MIRTHLLIPHMSTAFSAHASLHNPESNSFALVAGEVSGDLLASRLLQALMPQLPAASEFVGIGGAHMQAAGFTAQWSSERLAVRGYVEALRRLPDILRIRHALIRDLLHMRPRAFIGIDAPDFNLGVEAHCRRAGIPTVHFISPSIWAWRGGRIKTIACAVDLMLCLFPFEPAIYQRAGVRAQYVGHPLADDIPMTPNPLQARVQLGLIRSESDTAPAATQKLIAILPGSRQGEIKRIAPVFFKAMAVLAQREPSLSFILPVATPSARLQLQPWIEAYPQLALTLVEGASHLALEAADAVLLASGTATLEAALYKKPMVISYQVPWLTAQIMKRQGYLPYIGLPNILAGRFVVPELLQHHATPEALADAVLYQLENESNRRELHEVFTQLHHTLKNQAAVRAAQAIMELVGDAS